MFWYSRLRGERSSQRLVARAERAYAPLDVVGVHESSARVRLAVDELQHADRFALGREHGHHEHGFRPIAGLLVERAVDAEG